MQKCALSLALRTAASGLILAALLLIGAPANAYPLEYYGVEPIWFPMGGANTGIGPGHTPTVFVDPSYRFLCAGGGEYYPTSAACTGKTDYELEVILQDLQPPIQFPQSYGIEPSMEHPLIVDSIWTVQNNTEEDLKDVLLAFTKVILEEFPGSLPGGYPDLPNGDPSASSSGPASAFGLAASVLGVDFLKIIEYSPDYYYFGGVELGDIKAGDSVELTVRYIVNNGIMPRDGDTVVLPPLGLVGAVVPEPSTALLLASGLLGLAVAGRRNS